MLDLFQSIALPTRKLDLQVEDGDGSSRLDYANTAAMSAGSADVLRASTHPITRADLTLPAKGTRGSLSWSSNLVVDTTASFIIDVRHFKASRCPRTQL